MLASSITNRNEQNSSSPFFQAGANVGDLNQYFNITPYTGTSGFATNDWWIIDLDPQFPLSGNLCKVDNFDPSVVVVCIGHSYFALQSFSRSWTYKACCSLEETR